MRGDADELAYWRHRAFALARAELERAHLSGIRVRVISDNLKADDTGSDVARPWTQLDT